MKLVEAASGQVVRNSSNGSHYRFERQERGKARIWPLELFPSGLLIPKPTPTLVEPDLDVIAIGPWVEDMMVEGQPTHSRRVYEAELVRKEQELVELQAAYEQLPKGGKGKQSKGSWANKVKNCEARVAVLKRGLGFVGVLTVRTQPAEAPPVGFQIKQLVQVPSGRPAQIMGFRPMGNGTYADLTTYFNGAAVEAAIPTEVLRPWTEARVATI